MSKISEPSKGIRNIQDILFEYLGKVIYEPEKAKLNIEELPDEFKDLGEGMAFLGQCVLEQKKFGKSLIAGDFNNNIPSVENGIAAPLKEVHGILKHLMWQSKEVAKGDYSQRLAHFGELSDAFNSMVIQLKEREDNLKRKNKELSNLQEMFRTITIEAPYYIIALNLPENTIKYLNRRAEKLYQNNNKLFNALYEKVKNSYNNTIITIDDSEILPMPNHYRIITTSNENDDTGIYMILNVTDEISKTMELKKMAYVDELTGLRNRRYAQSLMLELQNEGIKFGVAFVDIDHLKYCNDEFGHEKGDEYIIEVSNYLKKIEGDKTICRVGGDEFIVVKPNSDKYELGREIEELHDKFVEEHVVPFEKSFSFGLDDYKVNDKRSISEILTAADCDMYQYKIVHKRKIEYRDDRM